MITLSLPCAIKGCLRYVRVQLKDDNLKSDEFVICQPCSSAILITLVSEFTATGALPPDTALEFARLLNGWFRTRKGVTLPVRPVGTATYRPALTFDLD